MLLKIQGRFPIGLVNTSELQLTTKVHFVHQIFPGNIETQQTEMLLKIQGKFPIGLVNKSEFQLTSKVQTCM